MPKISGLYIYPIKATRAISCVEANVLPRGLEHDRRWMMVDENDHFLTQRTHPIFTQIRTEIGPTGLILHAEGHPSLTLPFSGETGSRLTVQIWKDQVPNAVVRPEATAWLHNVLGEPVQLVEMAQMTTRPIDRAYGKAGENVSFADGYPLMLLSEASLEDLNQRLQEPVPMNRFRPNVVVRDCAAFAEDTWKKIRMGEVIFRVAKPCARCIVTTTDQVTGERGKEPLRTLATYRNYDGKIHFGQNLIPENKGRIQRGDSVEILA